MKDIKTYILETKGDPIDDQWLNDERPVMKKDVISSQHLVQNLILRIASQIGINGLASIAIYFLFSQIS